MGFVSPHRLIHLPRKPSRLLAMSGRVRCVEGARRFRRERRTPSANSRSRIRASRFLRARLTRPVFRTSTSSCDPPFAFCLHSNSIGDARVRIFVVLFDGIVTAVEPSPGATVNEYVNVDGAEAEPG